MSWLIVFSVLWTFAQIAAVLALVWLSWRYFDRRYKAKNAAQQPNLLSGELEPTTEVFIDPRDGNKYRVYYNRRTGEREYVEEQNR